MSPGEELIRQLEELRLRLNISGTERTVGIKDALGADCPYYKKSLNKFLSKDYIDLRNMINSIEQTISLVEGPTSDR